eukprot:Hpha_TRINITY_DN27035_c0_g1::TRINITY_DN27035_c0_g1_i1::g.33146::m.33146
MHAGLAGLYRGLPRPLQCRARVFLCAISRREELVAPGCRAWVAGSVLAFLYEVPVGNIVWALWSRKSDNCRMKLLQSLERVAKDWADTCAADAFDVAAAITTPSFLLQDRKSGVVGPFFLLGYPQSGRKAWAFYVKASLENLTLTRLRQLGFLSPTVVVQELEIGEDVEEGADVPVEGAVYPFSPAQ